MAPLESVSDMLGRNVRYHHDVSSCPQMITALHRAWAAILLNDIRTIIGPMYQRCTACLRDDRGHISN